VVASVRVSFMPSSLAPAVRIQIYTEWCALVLPRRPMPRCLQALSGQPVGSSTLNDTRPVADPRLFAAGLGLAAILPYLPVLTGGFVWDDHSQLELNTRFALADLPGYWLHAENAFAEVGRPAKYNPLGWSLFLLESVVSGGARPAWLYHASSLAMHGLAVGLFGLLLLSVARRCGWPRPRLMTAAAALWFAWAPIQSEVVCWPSARFDSLAMVLLAAGGLVLLRARTPAGRALGGLLAAASLLSKEAALPGVLLIAPGLAWLQGMDRLRAWREWVPGLLGAAGGIAAVMVVRKLVGVSLPSGLEALPMAKVVASEANLLRLAVLQERLSLMRPIPASVRAADLAVSLGVAALGVVGLARSWKASGRMAAFGALWLGSLTVLGATAAVRYELLPDRYCYLAMPGMAMIVGAAALEVAVRSRPRLLRGFVLVLCGVGLLFAARDLAQTGRFDDDIALFRWEQARFPDAPQTAWFLGMVLAEDGQLDEAEEQLQLSTRLGPALPQTWRELAALQARRGRFEEALHTVDAGLAELPGQPALVELRSEIVAAGDTSEARDHAR